MSEIRPESVVLATDAYLGHWSLAHQTAKRTSDPSALFYFADDADVLPLICHQVRKGQGRAEPGKRFRLYLVECDDEAGEPVGAQGERRYGQSAQALKLSGFFRAPDVWRACGSDAEFRDWTTRQPSIVSGDFNEVDEAGERRNVACHVRRAGEAGTAHEETRTFRPASDL